MPVHTPGTIGSGGNDDQGAQQTNLAQQYPNTVDTLAGMQYPDMPGGPDSNAPRTGNQQTYAPSGPPGEGWGVSGHTFTNATPYVPGNNVNPTIMVGTVASKIPDMPQYGAVLGKQLYEAGPPLQPEA